MPTIPYWHVDAFAARPFAGNQAAVMVLDAAKGIESQTRKLFEVCRMRDIPIITFINKMDREAREPFELLDEIQNLLALDATPAAWPVGRAADFAGVYDLATDRFLPVAEGAEPIQLESPEDPKLAELVGDDRALALSEEVLLARAGYPEFDAERFLAHEKFAGARPGSAREVEGRGKRTGQNPVARPASAD